MGQLLSCASGHTRGVERRPLLENLGSGGANTPECNPDASPETHSSPPFDTSPTIVAQPQTDLAPAPSLSHPASSLAVDLRRNYRSIHQDLRQNRRKLVATREDAFTIATHIERTSKQGE